jgi:hypothetical protein
MMHSDETIPRAALRVLSDILGAGVLTVACISGAFAAGEYDGEWQGNFGADGNIGFTITDDELVGWYIYGTSSCSLGDPRLNSFGIYGSLGVYLAAGGDMEHRYFVDEQGAVEPGSSFHYLVQGAFDPAGTAQGVVNFHIASLVDERRVADCSYDASWQASRQQAGAQVTRAPAEPMQRFILENDRLVPAPSRPAGQ